MFAAVPVPPLTTPFMMSTASAAMAGSTAGWGCGSAWYRTSPSRVVMLTTGLGWTWNPPNARVP
jgi:hypothetical protein